jgi:hypothetical protein
MGCREREPALGADPRALRTRAGAETSFLKACRHSNPAGTSAEMPRRLASISLLSAWLCASGAMLDVAQVVAWTRMFAGHVRTESLVAAARETFDPGKPCEICRAVTKCRDSSGPHGPAVPTAGAEKIILVFERTLPFVILHDRSEWPRMPGAHALVCNADVPVPPPRGAEQIGVG